MDAAKVMRGEMSAEDLAYKLPADGQIWGGKYPRPSALAKVTGTLDYGADLGLKLPPGALHLALVQADISHANILSNGHQRSRKNARGRQGGHPQGYQGEESHQRSHHLSLKPGRRLDRPILCDEKVFQYGDALAIVCAYTEAEAKAAAGKVKVDLEALPAYMSAPAAMAEDAMEIHPGTPNIYFTQKIAKGEDTGPVFSQASAVVEDDFYVGRQPHMPMEPDVGLAFINEDGKLYIHSKSIGLHLHSAMIAEGLGVALENMVMVQNPAGGTFGYKFSPTMEALVGAACLATGKPVFLRYDYHQQMTLHRQAFPLLRQHAHGRRCGRQAPGHGDGLVRGPRTLLRVRRSVDPAWRPIHGCGIQHPQHTGGGAYGLYQPRLGVGLQAYGSPQSEFASEVLMDELAEKLGMDPLELRFKNVYREGDTTPPDRSRKSIPCPR